MNRRSLIIISLIFCSLFASAQIVSKISFQGLKKTKENYVRQFLKTKTGMPLDSSLLESDKQRLANLEMFSSSSYSVVKRKKNFEVVFACNELHTLLPIFSFGGIKENFWIQAGVAEANLGGKGNKLTTYYQYYDRHSLALHLTFDRIRQSNWGLNVNLIKWGTLEPLYFGNSQVEYKYGNYTIGATGVRHFNYRDKVEFGGAFFTENYKKASSREVSGAPDEVDKQKVLGKVVFTWNRVNSHFFYLDGWHNQLNLQTVQSLNNDPAFYIFFNDLKVFKRIGVKGNFASRVRFGLSTNENSPFAPFVLDSYVNIRGVGNRVDRGTGAIIVNLEYRRTLLDKKKIAIQGVAFSDTGSWRNPGGSLSDFGKSKNFELFAGGGFRFIHKKIFNAIFRVDYGFNLKRPELNGFVLGVGQYF